MPDVVVGRVDDVVVVEELDGGDAVVAHSIVDREVDVERALDERVVEFHRAASGAAEVGVTVGDIRGGLDGGRVEVGDAGARDRRGVVERQGVGIVYLP